MLLIAGPAGNVLIDCATAEAVPSILANIRTLGFDPRDVKLIVGSHEHHDHMGGFAGMAEATGAQVWTGTGAAALAPVSSGEVNGADPQFGLIEGMAPVEVAGSFAEGERIVLGGQTFPIVPLPTPGHIDGGTSWSWQSCEGEDCVIFAYVDSLSAVSQDGYRFADHPKRVAPFRTTFSKVAAMPCDILVTPHPGGSNLFARLAGQAPLADPLACRTLAETARQRLGTHLAEEAAD